MSNLDKLVMPIEEMKFENKDNFEILVIKPNKISDMDWNHPDYLNALLNQDFFEVFSIHPSEYAKKIAEILNVNDFEDVNDVNTNIFAEEQEYLYEISYLNVPKKSRKDEIKNETAGLLDTEGEDIYGNVIIYKTYLPLDSNSNSFKNMEKKDLFRILDDRAYPKLVYYENEHWTEKKVGDLQKFSDELFDDDKYKVKKMEIPFLLHNINIWYVEDKYGEEGVCGNLVNKFMEKCIFFSRINEEKRTNLYLDDVKKIIELSKKLDNYIIDKEIVKEEKDDLDRDIVKNRFRALHKVYKSSKREIVI